ncbi:hypothetical protein [Azospirillum agricola]|uniref:hypothetical protein n=1 Tax=Azospirillum agricola TaxID=1720247 RepID=UPI0015C4D988|nr:hypothetical protein [Azospirillum agricola]
MLTIGRNALTKTETAMVAAVEGAVPRLVKAREAVAVFQSMIWEKHAAATESTFLFGDMF